MLHEGCKKYKQKGDDCCFVVLVVFRELRGTAGLSPERTSHYLSRVGSSEVAVVRYCSELQVSSSQ
jgi:hypothetical protein